MQPPATAAVICALAAAAAWAASGETAPPVGLGLFHNGTLVKDHSITLVASGEPMTLELRLGHWERDGQGVPAFRELDASAARDGSAQAISAETAWWSGSGEGHADPVPPTTTDHGNGTASLAIDRSAVAYGQLFLTAGEASKTLAIRVLPQPPPPGYGSADGPPHPPPRIAAQARLPLCADVAHGAGAIAAGADPHGLGSLDYLSDGDALSGVPPIEGTVHQEGFHEVPVGEPEPEWDWPGWGCHTWASFGTQAPQLLRLCEIPGHDRARHYAWHPYDPAQAMSPSVISPYTGYLATLPSSPVDIYATAPGPYWEYVSGGSVTVPYRPGEFVPHSALHPVRRDGTADMLLTRVVGTYSSAPELLPFDNLLAIRATGFHADGVTFEVSAGAGVGLPREGALARVNGTAVPVEIVRTGAVVGTVARASVSVSEVAWQNGILVRGITDGHATAGSIVRDLHTVTLVAEMPVDAGGGRDYDRLDPSRSVEPWGCWPRAEGEPMRVGSRDAWPAAPREGARMLPTGPEREHVVMGEPANERMEAAASPEPAFVDVRAPEGWGEGTVISARVPSSPTWPMAAGAAAPKIDVANRGDGTAVLGIERLEPGEHTIELTATGPPGVATEVRTLRIVPPAGAGAAPNLEPELAVLVGGEPAGVEIALAASPEPAVLELRADDPEGDHVRFAVSTGESSYGNRAASMVRLDDHGDGTAALHVDRPEPGELVLDIFAADAHGESMATHLVRVAAAPGAALYMDGSRLRPPLVELPVSAAPAPLEARAGHGGDVSVRALRSSHWGSGEAPEPPRVEARGAGAVAVWVDASVPGEHLVRVSDAGGPALYVIRVLPVAAR